MEVAEPPLSPSRAYERSSSNKVISRSDGGSQLPSSGGEPFLIGVSGGTASGKTTVCDKIIQSLHENRVVLISTDSYYRGLTPEQIANVKEYNFDHPDAFDNEAILEALDTLAQGKPVDVPIYDFVHHRRSQETKRVNPADVVIIEGILLFYSEDIRNRLNMKIFVDTDDDVRLARRIQRDTASRGRDVSGVIEQYTKFVKPAFDTFVRPTQKFADVIIPWGRGDNHVAIDLIVQHIRTKLGINDLRRIYTSLNLIPSNFQIRGLHTILRDRNTTKHDFVFYADRLNRIVVEAGLGHLPFAENVVTTPTGSPYVGVEFSRRLCGVSVIRSGESMENALRACCKGIKIGKILIQRDANGKATPDIPAYVKLPTDISQRHVLLMDPILATGKSVSQAIEVLLQRGVTQDRILFICLIAAPEGVHEVCRSYPGVKVITSEIDQGLGADYRVVPGVGEFGDRYFGTE